MKSVRGHLMMDADSLGAKGTSYRCLGRPGSARGGALTFSAFGGLSSDPNGAPPAPRAGPWRAGARQRSADVGHLGTRLGREQLSHDRAALRVAQTVVG